jgi:hypothetical protein
MNSSSVWIDRLLKYWVFMVAEYTKNSWAEHLVSRMGHCLSSAGSNAVESKIMCIVALYDTCLVIKEESLFDQISQETNAVIHYIPPCLLPSGTP